MNLPKLCLLCLFIVVFSHVTRADSLQSADEFIKTVRTVTYDCPTPSLENTLDNFLSSSEISEQQRFELVVSKAHYLNCNGKESAAQLMLKDLVSQNNVDQSARYYALAVYQIGFTYDVQERNERCDYYADAFRLSEDKFSDVEMSSTLGLITNCDKSGYDDDSEKMAAFFALIDKYSKLDNPGALAHIHNNLGLFLSKREQHILAAEQFLKAHEIGEQVYTGSNRLSILISAISSLLAIEDHERAKQAIDEFALINEEVSTPLTNFWYYHALTGYLYRAGKIDELSATLSKFYEVLPKRNKFYVGLYEWYNTVPCLHKKDIACLQAYLDKEKAKPFEDKQYSSYRYHQFLVQASLAVGDIEQASQAFETLLLKLNLMRSNQGDLAKIIGIANLYGKIYVLESQIEVAERRKQQMISAGAISILLLLAGLIYVIHKRRIARQSIDAGTDLLNSKTAIAEIAKVESPSSGKTNALAIFDLGNFREVNRQVGSTKGDYVLKKIASTLKSVTRSNDILGRFAPEQFILCLTDIEEGSAKSFFERVQKALESTFMDGQHGVNISIRSSMSIYITNEKFEDLNAVLDDMLLSLSIKSAK